MIRDTLNIGDSGESFRSKFNGNSTNSNIRVYNVEDYGAVHDDLTDDTAAIQATINACFDAGGGTVYFPNGVYIIAGVLQNSIGDDLIDYNSQLYIPFSAYEEGIPRIGIKLVGESWSRTSVGSKDTPHSAVTLKSTIAGTGVWPSVISAMGAMGDYGRLNYTTPILENLCVYVEPFNDIAETGPSMCGINLLYASHSITKNLTVSVDAATVKDCTEPSDHVFGIAIGAPQNDHPIADNIWVGPGFYYGLMVSEGVRLGKIEVFWCYIGFHFLKANVPITCGWLHALGCKYSIASQQEDFYEITAGNVAIDFQFFMFETDDDGSRCPTWCIFEDFILDVANRIKGFMNYEWADGSGTGLLIDKSNGGLNLFVRSLRGPTGYHWRTAERSFSIYAKWIVGFNTTTSRMEYFTGGAFKQLTEDV